MINIRLFTTSIFLLAILPTMGQENPTVKKDYTYINNITNDARWRIYCAYAMDTVFIKKNTKRHFIGRDFILFGELSLQVCEVTPRGKQYLPYNDINQIIPDYTLQFCPVIQGDTIKFYNLISKNDWFEKINIPVLCYSKKIKKKPQCFFYKERIITFDTTTKYSLYCADKRARDLMIDPFQPPLIKFIRENPSRIDPWFLSEARKRGMFDTLTYPSTWIKRGIEQRIKETENCELEVDEESTRKQK
jgi:hypothetical protein